MLVSLIIPAHNEEARLAMTLDIYMGSLYTRYGIEAEIIVVANGCTDRTVQVATDLTQTYPTLRVIDIAAPIGKGGAILQGFRHAQGARIVFADADAATSPDTLLKLVDDLDNYDVVIGSRRLPTSAISQKQPIQRRIFSRLFSIAIWLLFKLPFQDTQCGAKAFRRQAAHRLAGVVSETRWAFDVDLLLCAYMLGLTVIERPVSWSDRDGSKLRVGSTMREVAVSLWRMKRRYTRMTPNLSTTHIREA